MKLHPVEPQHFFSKAKNAPQEHTLCDASLRKRELLVHRVLELLAGLEHGALAGGDLHGLLGGGVDALVRGALLHLEGAKAHQRDLLALGQGLGDAVENGRDDLVGILAGQAALLGHGGDEFSFIHEYKPPEKV